MLPSRTFALSCPPFRVALLAVAAAIGGTSAPVLGQDPQPDVAERLRELEEHARRSDEELTRLREQMAAAAAPPPRREQWYDRLSIRGYGQFRFATLFGEDNTPDLDVPNDRSVGEEEAFILRRGRVILFGDVSERVYVYAQLDFAGSTGAADLSLQMRDFYADIALDDDKEFRVRPGVSKVPFGFVNMQSSQNRGPLERPDAINSAVEGERDFGVFFYWAPKEKRRLYSELTRSGRKGSGDYGVVGFGPYNGQGLNRSDRNGEPHWVGRIAWPFEFDDGQVLELGVQGYWGDYVPSTTPVLGVTPTFEADGVRDERVGVTAVWYPQPFGIEAEWNWGNGPTLSSDGTRITSEYLQGGYVQAGYLHQGANGTWYPFVRWNYFDGARKFGRNAPRDEVDELDVGCEFSPWPALELVVQYTHTFRRTDTSMAPYDDARGEDRIGFQVQFNF